jgi:hypothetical protein
MATALSLLPSSHRQFLPLSLSFRLLSPRLARFFLDASENLWICTCLLRRRVTSVVCARLGSNQTYSPSCFESTLTISSNVKPSGRCLCRLHQQDLRDRHPVNAAAKSAKFSLDVRHVHNSNMNRLHCPLDRSLQVEIRSEEDSDKLVSRTLSTLYCIAVGFSAQIEISILTAVEAVFVRFSRTAAGIGSMLIGCDTCPVSTDERLRAPYRCPPASVKAIERSNAPIGSDAVKPSWRWFI